MDLDDEVAEALKRLAKISDSLERVVGERALNSTSTPAALLDARQVAERLGVSRDWVYEHARELGAIRIGSGPKPRLRFPPDVGIVEHQSGDHPTKRAGRAADGRKNGLIPIYDG